MLRQEIGTILFRYLRNNLPNSVIAEFKITIPLEATGSYLFLPLNGNWDHKFGGASATGGTLLVDNAVPGSNTPGPGEAGTYSINVNFFTMQYSVIKQ